MCVPLLQLMSSIKTVLMEMLSQFEAKGKMGAKVIREQLHTAWPVPGSRTIQEQLRKELLQQLNHELEVVSEGVCVLCVCGGGGGGWSGTVFHGACTCTCRCEQLLSWRGSRW